MPFEDNAFHIEEIRMPGGEVVKPPAAERYDETAWKHPFRTEAFLDAARGLLGPEAALHLMAATIPDVPTNATVSERMTIRNIQRRRGVQEGTTEAYDTRLWVIRTLYEESFAVAAAQPDTFVPTVGGVISHYHRNEAEMDAFVNGVMAFGGDPLAPVADILTAMHTSVMADNGREDDAWNLLVRWNAEGVPHNNRQGSWLAAMTEMSHATLSRQWMRFPDYFAHAPRFAANFREAAMYMRLHTAIRPEMAGRVNDAALLKRFDIGEPIDRATFLFRAWGKLGSSEGIFDDGGGWRQPGTPECADAAGKLLALRTHPEFQFLYRDYTADLAVKRAFPSIAPLEGV